MSEFVAPDGARYALFGSGGGEHLAEEIGVPLVARIPLEPAVSAGGDTGAPVALSAPESPAGAAFHALAERVATDLLPPIEMSGLHRSHARSAGRGRPRRHSLIGTT